MKKGCRFYASSIQREIVEFNPFHAFLVELFALTDTSGLVQLLAKRCDRFLQIGTLPRAPDWRASSSPLLARLLHGEGYERWPEKLWRKSISLACRTFGNSETCYR